MVRRLERRSSSPGSPVDQRARPLTARRCDRQDERGSNARHEGGTETVGEGGAERDGSRSGGANLKLMIVFDTLRE